MSEKSSLEVTDEQSAAVQKTKNRVTLASLEEKIISVEYYRPVVAPHFTLAILKMSNGYIVTGQSAPADPENFNEDIGKRFAYEDAVRKLWPIEGYFLCEKLMASQGGNE